MPVTRIANSKCRSFTSSRTPFKGSNLYAENLTADESVYVVYSYGEHFPLFAFVKGKWYGNADGYSSSTARHKTYADPRVEGMTMLETRPLRDLIARAQG